MTAETSFLAVLGWESSTLKASSTGLSRASDRAVRPCRAFLFSRAFISSGSTERSNMVSSPPNEAYLRSLCNEPHPSSPYSIPKGLGLSFKSVAEYSPGATLGSVQYPSPRLLRSSEPNPKERPVHRASQLRYGHLQNIGDIEQFIIQCMSMLKISMIPKLFTMITENGNDAVFW